MTEVDHVRWISDRPSLRTPVLVVAFEGWNDAGDAATTAAQHVIETFDAQPFADLDPEPFYDFTTTRPFVRIDDEQRRTIDWPSNEFSAAVVAHPTRDLRSGSQADGQLKGLLTRLSAKESEQIEFAAICRVERGAMEPAAEKIRAFVSQFLDTLQGKIP